MQNIEQEMARFAEDASFAALWASIKDLGRVVMDPSQLEKLKGYPNASKSPEFPLFLIILSEAGESFIGGNDQLIEFEAQLNKTAEERNTKIKEKYQEVKKLQEEHPEEEGTKIAAAELEKLREESRLAKKEEQERFDILKQKLIVPFYRRVEENLAILFPSRAALLPEVVGELAFCLFASVYAKRDKIALRNGLTIIDHYFDLTIEDIENFSKAQSVHFSGFAQTCGYDPIKLHQWSELRSGQSKSERNEEFFQYKWKLLKTVFDMEENKTCPYPGVYIVDDLLDALETNEPTIRNIYPNLKRYFPSTPFVTPRCMDNLSGILQRIDPDQLWNDWHDIITHLHCENEQDKVIVTYLLSYCRILVNDTLKSVTEKTNIFGKTTSKYEAIAEKCRPYVFFHKLCQVTSFFVPGLLVSDLIGKYFQIFLNSSVCDTIFNRCSDIVEIELKKDIIQEEEKSKGNKKYKKPAPDALLDNKMLTSLSAEHCIDIGCILALTGLSVRDLNNRFNRFMTDVKTARKEKKPEKSSNDLIDFFKAFLPRSQKNIEIEAVFNIKKIEESSACGALLLRHYRFQALNHMMYQEIHFLDPVISDTLCEIRPSFLIDCDIILQDALISGKKFEHLTDNGLEWRKQVAAYNKNYIDLPWDESHINMGKPSAFLGRHCVPYIYIQFCRCLEEELVEKGDTYYPRYLTLCKINTRTSFLIRDRMNIEMGEDSITIMPGKEKNRRRSEMGFYNTLYVKKAAKALQIVELPDIGKLSDSCPSLNMTIESITNCHVVTPSNDIEVVPIYQAQMFTLLKVFSLNRPLIVKLKRIHITTNNEGERTNFPHVKSEGEIVENANYEVVGSRVFAYKPDYEKGRFVLIPENEEEKWAEELGMAVSAYSILDLTYPDAIKNDPGYKDFVDTGYYAEDPQAYFDFFETQDILNLLNACSANHPVFLTGAKGIKDHGCTTLPVLSYEDEGQFWNGLSEKRRQKTEIQDPFALLLQLYNQKDKKLEGDCNIKFGAETSLYFEDACDDFIDFFRLGEVLGLSRKPYKAGRLKELKSEDNGKTHSCVDTPVIYHYIGCMPFYSIHIYGSTLAIERIRIERGKTKVDRFEDEEEMLQRAIQASFEEYNSSRSMKQDD